MKKIFKILVLIIPVVCLLFYVFIYIFPNKKDNEGMVNKYYGIVSKNREALYEYCKSIPKPMVINLTYDSHFYKYSGLSFQLAIKDCDSLPNESVCLDSKNCFIKYDKDSK